MTIEWYQWRTCWSSQLMMVLRIWVMRAGIWIWGLFYYPEVGRARALKIMIKNNLVIADNMCAPLNESRIRIRWHWLTVKCILHQALFQYLRLADFGRWRRNCSEGNAAIRMAIRCWGGDLRRVMQWHWLMRRCWSDVGHETAQAMPGVLVVDGKIDPVLMARGTVRNSTGSSFLRERVAKRLF